MVPVLNVSFLLLSRFPFFFHVSVFPTRGSLADQLKVDELWREFRKIAEETMPPAFPAFFQASEHVQLH